MGTRQKFIAPLLIFSMLVFSSCREEQGGDVVTRLPGSSAPSTMRWSTGNLPLNIKTADTVKAFFVAGDNDADGHDPVEQMMKEWNGAGSLNFITVPSASTPNKDLNTLNSFVNDGEMGIYRINSWFPDVSGTALAITQFFGVKRNVGTSDEFLELTHADIMINFDDFSFTTDSSSTSDYHLPSVIVHELGHFLGLAHSTDFFTSSVMLPFFGKSDFYPGIFAVDRNNIQSLYSVAPLSPSSVAALNSGPHPDEGQGITGYIELHEQGICRHRLGDQVIYEHKVRLK